MNTDSFLWAMYSTFLFCQFYLEQNIFLDSKFTYLSNIPTELIAAAKFCRIQNLHISQTLIFPASLLSAFCRIQNLHISQTIKRDTRLTYPFCRIQNLHISQT